MKTIVLSVYGTGHKPIKDFDYPVGEGANVISLLGELKSKNMLPKRFEARDDFEDLIVIINHRNIIPKQWTNHFLDDGDRVLILPALAGG